MSADAERGGVVRESEDGRVASATVQAVTPEPFITESAMAARIGVSTRTIFDMRRRGDPLPPAIVVGRRRRYRASEVDQWLAAQRESSEVAS